MCNKVPQMCVSSGPTVFCPSPFLLSYFLTLRNQNASTHHIQNSPEQFHKLASMNVIPAFLPPCIILPSCTLPGQILSACFVTSASFTFYHCGVSPISPSSDKTSIVYSLQLLEAMRCIRPYPFFCKL